MIGEGGFVSGTPCAITGVGYSRLSFDSGESVLDLASAAVSAAIADAGMQRSDIDGVVSFNWNQDSVPSQAVATALGLGDLGFVLDLNLGGQAPSLMVMLAAMAVSSGLARTVVVYRALNGRSGGRLGRERESSPFAELRYVHGLTAYPQLVGMWARRFLEETGTSPDHLGAVVRAQREYAHNNPRAMRRRLITQDEYTAEPFLVDPFRSADCTLEIDGACAVVVTSVERGLATAPAVAAISGGAWVSSSPAGLDPGDVFGQADLSRNFTSRLADTLWRSAGLGPGDVDFAQIYDCFSSNVLFGLEGLGFVERGAAGAFVSAGETLPEGRLPTNTNGGLLCEGYLQGMSTIAEAAVQIRGVAGARQLRRHDVGVVTSGAFGDGSALVLTRVTSGGG